MKPKTIAGILRSRADSSQADHLAIRFKQADRWVEWTWREYWEKARSVEAGLVAAGVGAGDYVLILVPEMQSAVASLFGVWALGAVPIQIGLPFQLTNAAGFLEQLPTTARRLEARFVILSKALADSAPDLDKLRLVVAEDLLRSSPAGPLPDPDDAPGPAFLQLTSGSTGQPRAVVVPHDRLLLHMASMSAALPSHSESMAVSWLPLHHDMGLLGGLLFPFYNGFPAHMISTADFRSRPGCWLEAISRFRGTITAAPPSAYAICLQLARRLVSARLDLSAWECAMVGAEPVSPDLLRNFVRAFSPCGFRAEGFFPVYGLAEATVAVTFPTLLASTVYDRVNRLTLETEHRAVPCGDDSLSLELVGVGRPIPSTEIQIVDDAGRQLEDRMAGEIVVRSPSLMLGYDGESAATAGAFRDGWLLTGDLGYQADGSLFITGRKKEVIIKGGHNLIPGVIEEIVSGVEGVRMGCVAAVGVRSAEQETEMVFVVAETRLGAELHKALTERIREALKNQGVNVDRIVLVEPKSLPKTTSGKIKRFEVAQTLQADRSTWIVDTLHKV